MYILCINGYYMYSRLDSNWLKKVKTNKSKNIIKKKNMIKMKSRRLGLKVALPKTPKININGYYM